MDDTLRTSFSPTSLKNFKINWITIEFNQFPVYLKAPNNLLISFYFI